MSSYFNQIYEFIGELFNFNVKHEGDTDIEGLFAELNFEPAQEINYTTFTINDANVNTFFENIEFIISHKNDLIFEIESEMQANANNEYFNNSMRKLYTPLMICAKFAGKYDLEKYVQILIDAGANLNILSTYEKFTALMYASKCTGTDSTENTIQMLINAGADINICSDSNSKLTAFHYACRNSHISENIIKQFIDAGANPNLDSEYWFSPLMMAVINKDNINLDIVKLLVNICDSKTLNKRCKWNLTFIDHMSDETFIELFDFLMTNPNIDNNAEIKTQVIDRFRSNIAKFYEAKHMEFIGPYFNNIDGKLPDNFFEDFMSYPKFDNKLKVEFLNKYCSISENLSNLYLPKYLEFVGPYIDEIATLPDEHKTNLKRIYLTDNAMRVGELANSNGRLKFLPDRDKRAILNNLAAHM